MSSPPATGCSTTILDLNAQAISCLQSGDCVQASKFLRGALSKMRFVLAGQQQQHESGVVGSTTPPNAQTQMCVPIVPFDTSSTFRVFDSAFVLSAAGVVHHNQMACTILYNLALCHTLAWANSSTSTEESKADDNHNFTTALQLYKMALSTLEEESLVHETALKANSPSLTLKLLAIFNNMVYLLYHQHPNGDDSVVDGWTSSTSETCHCTEAMRALLGNCQNDRNISSQEVLLFRRNLHCLLLTRNKKFPIAPAA